MNTQCLSNLYFFPDHALFFGNVPHAKLHSHHAMEIFIGLKKPVYLISEEKIYQNHVLLIRSNVPHLVTGIEDEKIIIILDTETTLAHKLSVTYLKNRPVAPLKIDLAYANFIYYINNPSRQNAEKIFHSVITALVDTDNEQVKRDERITMALNYIRNLEIKKISSKKIADHIGLSEGRLIHLFKEQVGTPIRAYLRWLRLIDAVKSILAGYSLTYAAHNAEFADYAHLSRSFSEMFGFSLSAIFKNKKSINIATFL